MFKREKRKRLFFDKLCEDYYEKVLHYLYYVLDDKTAAHDCTQDVFLIAWEKCAILEQHPNPGGFVFQTAKNLAGKARRDSFKKMVNDVSLDENTIQICDSNSSIETIIDHQIDEFDYIDAVLSQLSAEKRHLYSLYYVSKNSMADIARLLHLEEATVRMRYVRLRREIREIANSIADKYFVF